MANPEDSGEWEDTTSVALPLDYPAEESESDPNRAYLIVLAGSNVGEMYKVTARPLVIGRGRDADVHLVDDGVSRSHCRVMSEGENLFVEDLDSRNGTFCNSRRIIRHRLADGDKIQVGRTTILKFTYSDKLDESFQKQMYDAALRDGLTRAYNRRYFVERLESEFRFALRHSVPLSLLMLDLDHFKRINDLHGHLAGDHVLAAFAKHVQRTIRNEDVFARYGGEEFAIISRAIQPDDARRFADRLRIEIEQLNVQYRDQPIPITVSIGISGLPEARIPNATALLGSADRALYRAKLAGRNAVAVFRDEDFEEPTQP